MKRIVNWTVETDIRGIMLMIGLIVLLSFGGVELGRVASARMLHSDALSTSSDWANSLVHNLDDLPNVFAGSPPSAQMLSALNEATKVGDV